MKHPGRRKKTIDSILFYFVIIFIGVTLFFPLFYTTMLSFMPKTDLSTFPLRLIPSRFVFDNYRDAFSFQPLSKYILNSFIIAMLSVAVNILVAFMAAYALVRTHIRGKNIFLVIILFMTLLPGITIIQPIYDMYKNLGLLDTYWGIALLAGLLDMPVSIWFLIALFKQVPIDYEDSARIDGANLFRILMNIYFPLLRSGIFSLSILVFINSWNQFLIAQILNMKESHRTVVVAITLYKNDFDINLGALAAAGVTTMLPILILVFLFQKRIIDNVLSGGVKG